MGRNRTGKFWWEYVNPNRITLDSMRGTYDPMLSSDCRCGKKNCQECEFGNHCVLKPWIAISSAEAWGEECLTPDELPDGDVYDQESYITYEELLACYYEEEDDDDYGYYDEEGPRPNWGRTVFPVRTDTLIVTAYFNPKLLRIDFAPQYLEKDPLSNGDKTMRIFHGKSPNGSLKNGERWKAKITSIQPTNCLNVNGHRKIHLNIQPFRPA